MSRILLVTQVYPPDTAAVGQHMADVAEALVDHGHKVTVLTSDRGYDGPNLNDPRLKGEGFGLRLEAGLGQPSVDG